jgi:integrase
MPTRVTADWMAQQWRDQKRIKKKLGAYPWMSLAQAREVFDRDFAMLIQRGRSIKIAGDTRPGTVADLFEAYVRYLKAAGKVSWKETEKGLNRVADTLGSNRPAREIEPDEIVEVIRPIYERGKKAMADHVRCYVHAAYNWGMKSEHDYRSSAPRRFRLAYNPAAGIPTEPKTVGTRWLDEDEFVCLYRWLEYPDAPVHPPYTRAVRILMLTGQRVEEIARLHVDQWNADERIIDWSKTKNGKPHAIPVPSLAAELVESIKPNKHGWFFPSAKDPARPVSHGTLYSFMWRQRDRGVIPVVTNRDLRRTWKTLAGKAGVPKEIRDRIQNHALQDVSSKSYDRWTYMPEKRAGMAKWDKFVRALLKKKRVRLAALTLPP